MINDNIQKTLYSVCWMQSWTKKQIIKEKQKVEKININSISSVKQTTSKTTF